MARPSRIRGVAFRVLALLLGLVVACLALELALSVNNFVANRSWSRASEISEREETLREAGMSWVDKVKGTRAGQTESYLRWETSLDLHPFFGYAYNPRRPDINNFGFRTSYDFVIGQDGLRLAGPAEESRRLVLGFFGGSFAEQTASLGQRLEQRLAPHFPGRRPTVLNFGVGGHAMPQALFIYSYFQELCDVAVFIDGLNEIWNAVENNKAGKPPEFAKVEHFRYRLALQELTPGRFESTQRLAADRERLSRVCRWSLLPVVRGSLLVHQLWHGSAVRLRTRIAQEEVRIRESYWEGDRFFEAEDEAVIAYAVRRWLEHHRTAGAIARRRGALDLHFLQPSPFLPETKHLTPEERKIVADNAYHEPFVLLGYPRLREGIGQLAAEGLVAEDLTPIFADRADTIWIDPAHASVAGYELILDRIADRILEHRDRLSNAP